MQCSDLHHEESHGFTGEVTSFPQCLEDHVILHPCFRYAEVKEALSHITIKLGLVEQVKTKIPYIFFYAAPNLYLHVMVSPFRYDETHLCYGFQYAFMESRHRSFSRGHRNAYFLSEWHMHPLILYLDLLKKIPLSSSRSCIDSSEPWKLLQEHPLYLDVLLGEDSLARIFSREERDLTISLDEHGFAFSTFSEVMSLAFWGVTPVFLDQLAAHGYTYFNIEELCSIWREKIPLSYLKGFADHGYNHFSAEEYMTFYSLDVDPASVGKLVSGVPNRSWKERIHLKRDETDRYRLFPS